MISPELFFSELNRAGVDYFTGVPDSLLKAFCAYVSDNVAEDKHVIACNEGSAVALGIGYHLATKKIPLVYMQNSGIGNAVNPLLSLADADVYSIPMILMIGWRGEPGVKDEPQHVKQGKVLLPLLESMDIPCEIIDENESQALASIKKAALLAKSESRPVALVVKKGAFDSYSLKTKTKTSYAYQREDVVKVIVDNLDKDDIVVSTTGMASRELFEYRASSGFDHSSDFLTVGGMGHASQIALAIASQRPERRVVCIDGDGAALMHLGALTTNGHSALKNFKHIVINNGAHDSVGGQPTLGFTIDFLQIAKACNYDLVMQCDGHEALGKKVRAILASESCSLLEVLVNKGSRSNLGRPTTTPIENKASFMRFISGD